MAVELEFLLKTALTPTLDAINTSVADKLSQTTTKAGEASASASSAAGSASTATTKAGEASASAATATTKAGEASASAATATTKAGEASASAATATTKAGEASASAATAVAAATNYKVTNASVNTTYTIDMALADNQFHYLTIIGNTTFTINNIDKGRAVYIEITQGGAGNFVPTFPGGVRFPAGAAIDMNLTAGTVTVITLVGKSTTGINGAYVKQ